MGHKGPLTGQQEMLTVVLGELAKEYGEPFSSMTSFLYAHDHIGVFVSFIDLSIDVPVHDSEIDDAKNIIKKRTAESLVSLKTKIENSLSKLSE